MKMKNVSALVTMLLWPALALAQGNAWPWAGDESGVDAPKETLLAQVGGEAGARGDIGIFADPELAGDPAADGAAFVGEPEEDDMPIIDEINGSVSAPDFVPLEDVSKKAGGGINVAAYEEILKENLTLRRELDAAEVERDDALADKERIEDELLDMERQLTESVDLLQRVKASSASPDADRIVALETELAEVEAENAGLRKQVDDFEGEAAMGAVPGSAPDVGSDLFKALQMENVELKRQTRVLQDERNSLAATVEQLNSDRAGEAAAIDQARGRESHIQEELDIANAAVDKYKASLDKLLQQIPEMEQELAMLRDTVDAKNRELETHDQQIEAMQTEIDKREWRLVKAERMQALMEKAREEVRKTSQKEKRDLHYNMASVYAREGRIRDAEKEYLRALRVDPTDPDSHYNLAILYEESLDNRRKAAVHFKAYLKLAPNAKDVDEVKAWLIDLEME